MASKRGRGVLRKDGQPRASSTGSRKPVVDTKGWRNENFAKHRCKFDDPSKQRYLDELRKTGRKWAAEKAAGVARATVDRHFGIDPQFSEEYEAALEEFATKGLTSIEREAIEGHEDVSYDSEGNVVRVRRVYETRLREMFLKKHDTGYQEKQKIEHSGEVAGIAIIPGVAPLSDWEESVRKHDLASAKSQDPDEAEIQRGDTQE